MSTVNLNLGEMTPVLSIFPNGHHMQREANSILNTRWSHYTTFLGLTREALAHLRAGNFPDPLVGENACQIRAKYFAAIAKNPNLYEAVDKALTSLDQIFRHVAHTAIVIPNRGSLTTLVSQYEASVEIPKMLLAAVLAHFLTVTKVSQVSFEIIQGTLCVVAKEENQPSKLQYLGRDIDPLLAEKVIRFAKKQLSHFSVEYVQRLAATLPPCDELKELTSLVSQVRDDGNGRMAMPCFAFMDILYRSALQEGIPFLLKVAVVNPESLKAGRFLFLYYEPTSLGYRYRENCDDLSPDQAVIVMEGYSMAKKPMEERDLLSLLLALPLEFNILGNDAAHHQYAGDKSDVNRPVSARCEVYRQIALKEGFCRENPSLCYLDHFYAGNLGQQLGKTS